MVEQEKINHYIDELKRKGYRPTLVCALVMNNRVAVFKNNTYGGYELVQGGFEAGESPEETLEREVIEELGFWFHKECNFRQIVMTYLFEEKMEMKIAGHLETRTKEKIVPKGKHYIVFAAEIHSSTTKFPQINPDDFSFKGTSVKLHQCRWVNAKEARSTLETITNPKKREIALRVIDLLVKKEFVL